MRQRSGRTYAGFPWLVALCFATAVVILSFVLPSAEKLGPLPSPVKWEIFLGFLCAGLSGGCIAWVLQNPLRFKRDSNSDETPIEQPRLEPDSKIKSLLDNVPANLAIFDRDMRCLHANEKFCELFGWKSAEIDSKSFYELLPNLPDGLGQACCKGFFGETTFTGGQHLVEHDGEQRNLRWMVHPWGESFSNAHGIVVSVDEVTTDPALEEQTRHLQKLEAIAQVAKGVSHDFNNLLTVNLTYARMILDTNPDKEIANYAQEILTSAKKGTKVCNQLLVVSQKLPLRMEMLNVNTLMSEFCRMQSAVIAEDINLVISGNAASPFICADQSEIEQVLMSLFINASDTMPDGGELTLITDNVLLPADSAEQVKLETGFYVRISATQTRSKVPSQSASGTETVHGQQMPADELSLGLAAMYRIVKRMHGAISVIRNSEASTSIEIYLPAAHDSDSPLLPERSGEINVHGETILLVEDEESLSTVLMRYLSRLGYNILRADSGPEALRLAQGRSDDIHVLLSDVVMPEMKGTELARQLKQLHPETKIVYMSGYPAPQMKEDVSADFVFLKKPIELGTLRETLREVLAGYRGDLSTLSEIVSRVQSNEV
jgi:two-component system, cell cycle sensor histidine kinase and response regulator CckA